MMISRIYLPYAQKGEHVRDGGFVVSESFRHHERLGTECSESFGDNGGNAHVALVMEVGVVAFSVNVMAGVEPSSLLIVIVVPEMLFSCWNCRIS